jgi:hypothetical protein
MNISTLEVETSMLLHNVRHQSPNDMMPHPRRTGPQLHCCESLKSHERRADWWIPWNIICSKYFTYDARNCLLWNLETWHFYQTLIWGSLINVRFEFLAVVLMKIQVFWYVAVYWLVNSYWCFAGVQWMCFLKIYFSFSLQSLSHHKISCCITYSNYILFMNFCIFQVLGSVWFIQLLLCMNIFYALLL